MHLVGQMRHWQWRSAGLSCLLFLAMLGFAIAQTDTSAPAENSPHSSATKAKHAAKAHAAPKPSSHSTAQKTKSKKGKKGAKTGKKRGQQVIDGGRARAIQEALIREHYMDGEPSGTWDNATQAAMQRYQADQGWQSKTTPDSRALIKLGLGPSHDHLLNPESAMTSAPAARDPKVVAKPNPADPISPSPSDRPQQ